MPPAPKPTDEQAREIYRRRTEEIPPPSWRALAAEYGVAHSAIKDTFDRVAAADVPDDVPAAAPSASAEIFPAAHSDIAPSPLNPRKRFDPEAHERMVASVRAEGVLTPLLVRRANQPGNTPVGRDAAFEIIGGERRWRGLGTLIESGERGDETPLLVRLIHPCDDAKYLELALTENGQRKDMTAWEEAEAFAALRKLGRSAAQIAEAVGLVKRTVEMRLRLFSGLSSLAQDALRDGVISVEQANVLAAFAPHETQSGWIDKILNNWFRTTRDLKLAVTKEMVPVEIAIFDLVQYTGAYVEEEDGGPRYFADFIQFRRLQDAAVAAAVARCQAGGVAWVKVFDERKGDWLTLANYVEDKGHPKAGAVIKISPAHAVEVIEGLVTLKDMQAEAARAASGATIEAARAAGLIAAPQAAEGAAAPGGEFWTRAHLLHAKRRQSVALQEAVAADRDAAMRLVCHALLLEASSVVSIRGTHHSAETLVIAPGPAAEIEAFLSQMGDTWKILGNGPRSGHFTDSTMVWRALNNVRGAALDRLFASLVALRVSAFNGHMPDAWCGAEALAIADSLGIVGAEIDHDLAIRPGDCDGLRREALMAIKRQVCDDDHVSDLSVKGLADHLTAQAPEYYVVPTLRFLPDRAAVEHAFRERSVDPRQIDIEEAIAATVTAEDIARERTLLVVGDYTGRHVTPKDRLDAIGIPARRDVLAAELSAVLDFKIEGAALSGLDTVGDVLAVVELLRVRTALAKAAEPSGDLDIGLVNIRRVLSAHSVFAAKATADTAFADIVGEEDFAAVAADLAVTFAAPTITADVLLTIEDLDHLAATIERHRAATVAEKKGEAA